MARKRKKCIVCRKPLAGRQTKYCSEICKDKAFYRKKHPQTLRNCLYCAKPLVGRQIRFCSIECQKRDYARKNVVKLRQFTRTYWRKRHPLISKKCPQCHKTFMPKATDQIFCSKKCRMRFHHYKYRNKYKIKTKHLAVIDCPKCGKKGNLSRIERPTKTKGIQAKYYVVHVIRQLCFSSKKDPRISYP